ncbi:methenyltetrahydromethanopterin cyclohydrolase [Aureliella helgolandensis]|uniref:Methenyltetrahydromethanopterin cyclohydrolase n=1 Tax=Aureliella helgolandensis TaxID=2527968 RepID=A0A518GGZ1_9BACT|nr:methenyltetrahydromethanopterin cyclohydrolase [Aureliella helgolandensis]QDV27866.1 Methenyltetrahydromethanopterin cyclohydrolase [Aureliella helgolandensis]
MTLGKPSLGNGLNGAALSVFLGMVEHQEELRVDYQQLANGTHLLDCGIQAPGGLAAGQRFAGICLAGQASLQLVPGERAVWPGPWVQVSTDKPVQACMLAQYAGWPVKHDKFFAMGSGPMRIRRGKEEILKSLAASDSDEIAVGTLESDVLPTEEVAAAIAAECEVPPESLYLAVAPTRSLAGCVQVVARSVETSLHKLHELGFPLENVLSGYGVAPVPPPTPNFAKGIGRTNDAILYGGHVSLWLRGEDEVIAELGAKLPSCASRDFGEPFAEIFKRYEYDFYKVDPGLFSPAEVTLMNVETGRSWRFGELRGDLVQHSFETQDSGVQASKTQSSGSSPSREVESR